MRLEVLHVRDCPNLAPLLERLTHVTDLPVATRLIATEADAGRYGMAGSPTLLVDGVDPFAVAGGCGMSCRLYRDEAGRIVPSPSVEQLRVALSRTMSPGEALSAWRQRAVPSDPIDRAEHHRILLSFAANGRPPDDVRSDVLRALHEIDAHPDVPGQILEQQEAESLAHKLCSHLLADCSVSSVWRAERGSVLRARGEHPGKILSRFG